MRRSYFQLNCIGTIQTRTHTKHSRKSHSNVEKCTRKNNISFVLNDVSVYVQMNAKFLFTILLEASFVVHIQRMVKTSVTFIFNADESLSESFIFHFKRTVFFFHLSWLFVSLRFSLSVFLTIESLNFHTVALQLPYQFLVALKLSERWNQTSFDLNK